MPFPPPRRRPTEHYRCKEIYKSSYTHKKAIFLLVSSCYKTKQTHISSLLWRDIKNTINFKIIKCAYDRKVK